MFDLRPSPAATAARQRPDGARVHAIDPAASAAMELERLVQALPVQRRLVREREYAFHAGQPRQTLHFVRGGCFKTAVVSADGREKITGFRMRGDLLGLDALDLPVHACDAVALDIGELWEIPDACVRDAMPALRERMTAAFAREIRRDASWMLALGTLSADQRVATFLLDLGARMAALGFSARSLVLRMTRAELGNFLDLTLETVTRALTRLKQHGLICVAGKDVQIEDAAGLRALSHGDGPAWSGCRAA